MSAPYVVIPQAIYEARDAGSISAEGFNIFVWSYRKAERPEFRVRSYSADRRAAFAGRTQMTRRSKGINARRLIWLTDSLSRVITTG